MVNVEVWSKLDMAICDLIDDEEITTSLSHVTLANQLYACLRNNCDVKEGE
jgi:hypothetical protein